MQTGLCCDMSRSHSSLTCQTDQLVTKAQTSSASFCLVLSSVYQQRNSSSYLSLHPHWSGELCLFHSIFSLYLQCSRNRGIKMSLHASHFYSLIFYCLSHFHLYYSPFIYCYLSTTLNHREISTVAA